MKIKKKIERERLFYMMHFEKQTTSLYKQKIPCNYKRTLSKFITTSGSPNLTLFSAKYKRVFSKQNSQTISSGSTKTTFIMKYPKYA